MASIEHLGSRGWARLATSTLLAKSYALVMLGVVDTGVPFIRMMILSRMLDLRELGFASVLAATYGTFELITDLAMHRFVFSRPRAKYEEALAAAHALSLARGVLVGCLVVACAPLIAAGLALSSNWESFATLGAIIVIRSLEHLEPKVAERDYHYGRQLIAILIANGLSLAALVATLVVTRDHSALVVSLLAQAIGWVTASHLLATSRYRLRFRSPLFKSAFRFGYPLMFNGLGLALSNQGDRFLVAALLGLPALGVYAVVLLVTIVPMTIVSRVIGTFTLAALYNASASERSFDARCALAVRVLPLLYAGYSLSIVTLMNIVVPKLFGEKFEVSQGALVFLAIGAFFRLARGEPFSSMLLQEGRTKRLALANLSSTSALLFATILIIIGERIEDAMLGRLLGEITAFVVTLYLTRKMFRVALWGHLRSVVASLLAIGGACVASFFTSVGARLGPSLSLIATYTLLTTIWALHFVPALLKVGAIPQNQDDDNSLKVNVEGS